MDAYQLRGDADDVDRPGGVTADLLVISARFRHLICHSDAFYAHQWIRTSDGYVLEVGN